MTFDFDTVLDRRGTGSLKWDFPARKLSAPDALPMWVADMDFAAPPAVIEALSRRLAHGAFGYASFPDSVREAAADWMTERFAWSVRPEWISIAPGVVPSLYACIRALTRPAGSRCTRLSCAAFRTSASLARISAARSSSRSSPPSAAR